MAKLEDLPNEVIQKVLGNLQVPDLLRCGRVSKRIRDIVNGDKLWHKVNLFNKKVPAEFLENILAKNCKYLSLNWTKIGLGGRNETGCAEACSSKTVRKLVIQGGRSQLVYLDLSWLNCSTEDIESLLSSCHFLEKLSLADMEITSKMIDSICTQNGKTLKSLKLEICHGLSLDFIRQIFTQCVKLKEINFRNSRISAATEDYLAEHMPSWVEKLDIGTLNFSDQNIMWVHNNCPKWFHYKTVAHRFLGTTCPLKVCIFHSCILLKKARNISLVRIP